MKRTYQFGRLSKGQKEYYEMILLEEIDMQSWYAIAYRDLLAGEIFLTVQYESEHPASGFGQSASINRPFHAFVIQRTASALRKGYLLSVIEGPFSYQYLLVSHASDVTSCYPESSRATKSTNHRMPVHRKEVVSTDEPRMMKWRDERKGNEKRHLVIPRIIICLPVCGRWIRRAVIVVINDDLVGRVNVRFFVICLGES